MLSNVECALNRSHRQTDVIIMDFAKKTFEEAALTTRIGLNTFQKFQLRQLEQWVLFDAIWPLYLDIPGLLRKLHTKHWFALSSSMQHLFLASLS